MAKEKGIPISPKHGLNPSMVTCFWCGKTMGVALVGRIRKDGDNDAEAPREACFDLNPCEDCKKKFATGVLAIEVVQDGSKFGGNTRFALPVKGREPMWPTGRWVVVRPEAMKTNNKAGDKILVSPEVMDRLLEPAKGKKGKAK